MIKIPKIEKLADLQWYTEGPVVDEFGDIFFTTLDGGKIMTIDFKTDIVAEWGEAKRPNGQLILKGGDHLVCDAGLGTVSRFNRTGKLIKHEIDGVCGGKKIFVPNDLVADAKGGVYFTDSVRAEGKVCYYTPDGEQKVIAMGLDFPNGIALSEDGKLLYVAESYRNRILVLTLKSDGSAEGKYEVFAELPEHPSGEIVKNLPDGVRVDHHGCVWVAHYGMGAVQVLSPYGELIRSIPTGLPLTSNLFLDGGKIIVTGGYGEPGPGAVLRISV